MLIKSFINNLIKLKKNIILFLLKAARYSSQSLITHKIKWNINIERRFNIFSCFITINFQVLLFYRYLYILFIIKYKNLIVFQIFFFFKQKI